MPKIPQGRKAGLIEHVRSGVPMTPRRLHNYGSDGTEDALQNFGRGFDRAVTALAEYQREFEQTQNSLAAAQARALFQDKEGELEVRFKDNPGSFNDFKTWAEETDRKYEEDVKQFTEKMTPDFRKVFEAEMAGIRARSKHQRSAIGRQAASSAELNLFQEMTKRAAERGDRKEYERLIKENSGRLISQAQAQLMTLAMDRIFDYYEAKRAVEAGVDGGLGQLREKDDTGQYRFFRNLAPTERDRLIKYAEGLDAERRSLENLKFVDRLESGEVISMEDIESEFAGKNSPEAQKQRLDQRQILRKFLHARSGYKAKASEQQNKAEYEKQLFQISQFKFSQDQSLRKKQVAEFKNAIFLRYPHDSTRRKSLLKELDESIKAVEAPERSYKNTTLYQDGQKILSLLKSQGLFAAGKEGTLWGVNEKEDTSREASTLIELTLTLDMDHYVQKNPNATEEELLGYLQKQLGVYNRSTCAQIGLMSLQKLLTRSAGRRVKERTMGTLEGRTGTYNGKKVIYKNGKIEYAE